MRIAIDGNEANVSNRVGVHQYAFEILSNLYRINERATNKNQYTIYLKSDPLHDLPVANKWWRYETLRGGKVWILSKLMPHLLKRKDHDVLFVPSHYAPPISRIPIVSTIHDLGYLEFSGQFRRYDFWQLKWWTAITLFVSKYIISISKATERDIVRHYGRSKEDKIKVIHHGLDHDRYKKNISLDKISRVKKKYHIPKNYILYLGTLKPSKNIEGIIKAFSKIAKTNEDISLVVAGRKGWMYESIYTLVEREKLQDRVIFTGYIKEDEKPPLYSGARLLMSPSFWEGFGMHILESYACGVPTIVSSSASIPEVAGDFAIYVNPSDVDDIAKKTENTLNLDKEEYNKLREKCIRHALKFSWEKSAHDTLKVLSKATKDV